MFGDSYKRQRELLKKMTRDERIEFKEESRRYIFKNSWKILLAAVLGGVVLDFLVIRVLGSHIGTGYGSALIVGVGVAYYYRKFLLEKGI